MNGPTDRGSFKKHVPCNCTPSCEHKHGDQADPELDELLALRLENAELRRRLKVWTDPVCPYVPYCPRPKP